MRRLHLLALACAAGVAAGCGAAPPVTVTDPAALVDTWGDADEPDAEKLPPPASLDAADADELARELAARVHSRNSREAVGALLAALHASGITVADAALGGRVVHAAGLPSQGITVQAGEVMALHHLIVQGHTVEMDDLAALFLQAAGAPSQEPAAVRDLVIAALRQHAASGTTTQRFWARFISALGQSGPLPYDLLDPRLLGSVPLDAVQTALLTWRMAADFAGSAPTVAHAGAQARAPLAASVIALPPLRPLLRRAMTADDCAMSETAATAMDGGAAAATTGFAAVLEWITENTLDDAARARLEKQALAHSAFGNLLAFAKVFIAGALTHARIEFVDGTYQLQRTRSSDASGGAAKQVRATIEMNTHGLQYLNCARVFLNAAGVDLNVGNDGPISGARVGWWVDHEGQSGIESAQNALVRYHSGDITRTETDDNGAVTVTIEGTPQKRDVPRGAAEVKRSATIGITYTLKESDLAQDLVDAVSAVAGGPVGMAAELLMRTLPQGAKLRFTVIDYASDYRIDHIANGVHFTSTKCGSPTGEWEIDISGDLGYGMAVSGGISVGITERSSGYFAGDLEIGAAAAGGAVMKFDPASFQGVATLQPGASRLVLEPKQTQAGMQLGSMKMPVGGPGSTLSLPFESGEYCEPR